MMVAVDPSLILVCSTALAMGIFAGFGRRSATRRAERQLRKGRVEDALASYLRAGDASRAADCAQRLGRPDEAARLAEQAGELDRAAQLYEQCLDFANAARLFARVGRFVQAAQVAEQDKTATPEQVANLWEEAAMDVMPPQDDLITLSELIALEHAAARAAEWFTTARDWSRAAFYYELIGDKQRVNELLGEITLANVRVQAGDRMLERIRRAVDLTLRRRGLEPHEEPEGAPDLRRQIVRLMNASNDQAATERTSRAVPPRGTNR